MLLVKELLIFKCFRKILTNSENKRNIVKLRNIHIDNGSCLFSCLTNDKYNIFSSALSTDYIHPFVTFLYENVKLLTYLNLTILSSPLC